MLNWEQRFWNIEEKNVIKQMSGTIRITFKRLSDFFVHGDDWKLKIAMIMI